MDVYRNSGIQVGDLKLRLPFNLLVDVSCERLTPYPIFACLARPKSRVRFDVSLYFRALQAQQRAVKLVIAKRGGSFLAGNVKPSCIKIPHLPR